MSRLDELTEMTAAAAMVESRYEQYRWDVDPQDILKLLVERDMLHDVLKEILKRCRADGPVSLLASGALQKSEECWANEGSQPSLG